MAVLTAMVATLALAVVVVLLARTAAAGRWARRAAPPSRPLLAWVAVAGVVGVVLPAAALLVDALAGRPTAVVGALLVGIGVQLAVERWVSGRGRSGLLGWVGLAFTLMRCAQLAILVPFPGGASGLALAAAAVLWPSNVVVLAVVLVRDGRAPRAPVPEAAS